MDVRCDRCQTEYELDEMRLTATGVAVKCTNCGNVFKVRRSLAEPAEMMVPAKQKVREWHVRRQDGTTLTLRELTELQKAVVERRVSPQDSVSLSGESWHQLGSMPELASFFEVVQAADHAKAPRRAPTTSPMLMAADGVAPAAPAGPGPRRQTWADGPQSFGPAPSVNEPAWTNGSSNDPELTDLLEKEDLQAVKRGRGGVWATLLALVLIGAGVGAYFYLPRTGAPGTIAITPPAPPDVNAPIKVPPEAAAAPSGQPVVAPTAPEARKPAVAANAPAAPTVAAAPAAVAPAPAPTAAAVPPPAAPAVAAAAPKAKPAKSAKASDDEGGAPSGKGFDYYISQGHKLLDSKPNQALALFQKAAEVDPSSPEPDSGRGLAYANMDRLGDAAVAFQAALKKSPEFTEAIMGLAEVSREQGNTKKAIGLYQRYLDLTPDGTDAPVARAQLEQLKGTLAADTPSTKTVIATPAPAVQPVAAPDPQPVMPPPPVVVPDQPAQ